MSESSITFTFHNQKDHAVELVFEPWGILEDIPGNATVTFEANALPPPEVEFSITKEGQPYVFVLSEKVRMHIDGVEKHLFEPSVRPAPGTFRVMNEAIFSKIAPARKVSEPKKKPGIAAGLFRFMSSFFTADSP